jgi:hypothetical protein
MPARWLRRCRIVMRQAERVALVEQVDEHGRHRLGGREDVEGRLGGARHLRGVRRVVRAVAGGVPDGAVDQDAALAADAELDRGMDAAAVEALDGLPDAGGAVRRHPDLPRIHLGIGADRGDLGQVLRDPAAADERREHGRILYRIPW